MRYLLKPSKAALGYALFLAVNATSVWGGVFPFLPMGFQTSQILFWFFFVQASVFSVAYLASIIGSYWFSALTRRFMVLLAAIPYLLGWVCLIAAMYLDEYLHGAALTLVVIGGGFLGLGSAGFYMMWQRLFAGRTPEQGTQDLIVGTAWAAVIYIGLYAIPRAVTSFLIPLVFLPLFGLCIVLETRTLDLDLPMFEDVPRDHPHVYRRALRDVWRSALCTGALGFCTGIMRSFAITSPAIGSWINVASMVAMLLMACVLYAVWHQRDITLNILQLYRIIFPIVITLFALLPVFGQGYITSLAAILYALHGAGILIMMIQCAQISRDRGINPVFIYGFFGVITYGLHDVGFIAASAVIQFDMMQLPTYADVALVAIYLLAMMFIVSQGGFTGSVTVTTDGNRIELLSFRTFLEELTGGFGDEDTGGFGGGLGDEDAKVAGGAEALPGGAIDAVAQGAITGDAAALAGNADWPGVVETLPGNTGAAVAAETLAGVAGVAAMAEPKPGEVGVIFHDRMSKQVELLRREYRLSSREAEVAELIARGNTVTRIAEELVVSENTIRTHAKRIYSKLNIHKKQELSDLLASLDIAKLD